jgi:hypothetical protein
MAAIISCFAFIVIVPVTRCSHGILSPILRLCTDRSWRFWFPPSIRDENLRSCPEERTRKARAALLQKCKNNAWSELYSFYQEQLRVCPDQRSAETIRRVLDHAYFYFHKDKHIILSPLSYQVNDQREFEKELSLWRASFPGVPCYPAENFYHRHGLRFIAPKPVLAYISHKDILDVGGSWGNSLVVLRDFTGGRVVSYGIVPSASRRAR